MDRRNIAAGIAGTAFAVLAFAALAVPASAQTGASEGMESMPHAVLQGLDKVTARVVTIEVPVGQPVEFGPCASPRRPAARRRRSSRRNRRRS